ncbi:Chaperone protein DnaJ, partial [Trichinella nativa]
LMCICSILLQNSSKFLLTYRCFASIKGSATETYYDVLGVSKDASMQEIKEAYFSLSKQYHPDLNKIDQPSGNHFKRIAEAYSVLGKAESRNTYDFSLNQALPAVDSKGESYSTSSVYDIFNKHPALTDLNKINPVKEMSERDLWKRRLTVGTFFFTTFAFTALLHFEKEKLNHQKFQHLIKRLETEVETADF